jgi:hypothetical protein
LGVTYNPNIVPKTRAERIALDAGNAAGTVAGVALLLVPSGRFC